jgi:membrane protein DedA with SNARE-associated domain
MSGDPVGAAMLLAAPLGLIGIFALALFERLAPLVPSAGLLTAVGVAAADGWWCLPTAIFVSVLGSGTGALAAYLAGTMVGALRWPQARRALRRRDRLGRALRSARRSGAALPFTAQLVPATRIAAPLIGAAVPHDRAAFLSATAAGLALWNGAFITFGYAVVRLGGTVNATIVSIALPLLGLASMLLLPRGRRKLGFRKRRG